MKKTIITIAIILGLGSAAFADGGLFQRGYNAETDKSGYVYYESKYDFLAKEDTHTPLLPSHGLGDNQNAPLGSGIVALMGLGTAYLVAKRHKQK